MGSCVDLQKGRYFYMEINPDLDMGEKPTILYTQFKELLHDKLTMHDLAGNKILFAIKKGYRTVVIVSEVKDHNMRIKGPCYPPVKLEIDVKPTVLESGVINVPDVDGDVDIAMNDISSVEACKSWADVAAEWAGSAPGLNNFAAMLGSEFGPNVDSAPIWQFLDLGECKFAFDDRNLIVDYEGKNGLADGKYNTPIWLTAPRTRSADIVTLQTLDSYS
ncbi:hypothetical protein PIB30_047315 [Stylosanthes scabra]|uniref:Uncharacterized protein n=1 Tax=Stylosanthes scabra TaxID=79078 RepID=A0ABU6ZFH0_9FABA|nr:hypothetical protein [Stylosanthes scabra]